MKVLRALLYVVIMAATVSLTGCSKKDYEESQPFNGIWNGRISSEYYTQRYKDADGWFTEIQFYYEDVSAGIGGGLQYDYNVETYEYKFYNFTWVAYDNVVTLSYDDSKISSMIWKNYSFTNTTLRGELYNVLGTTKLSEFILNKIGTWVDYSQQPKYTEWY